MLSWYFCSKYRDIIDHRGASMPKTKVSPNLIYGKIS